MLANHFPGRPLILVAALVSILFCTRAEPTPVGLDSQKQSFQRFEEIESGDLVRVRNEFGNVYARFGGYGEKVELLATLQRLDDGLPELELRSARNGSVLHIDVVVAGEATASAPRRDRLDLVVFVPQGVALDVTTVDDSIEAKGIKGDVSASSIEGEIRLHSIRGTVRAKSSRGDVTVVLETGATDQPQEITTETGEIELYLWEDADMHVDLATSGEISTDFSIALEHRRFEEPGKYGVAVVGAGHSKLVLRSKQGRIRLLRLQKETVPEN